MNVQARYVEDVEDHPDTPGAWDLVENRNGVTIGMTYVCPCGCGQEGYLPFRYTGQTGDTWIWNKSTEAPTLEPSVHHIYHVNGEQKTHWHGWLKNGVWSNA